MSGRSLIAREGPGPAAGIDQRGSGLPTLKEDPEARDRVIHLPRLIRWPSENSRVVWSLLASCGLKEGDIVVFSRQRRGRRAVLIDCLGVRSRGQQRLSEIGSSVIADCGPQKRRHPRWIAVVHVRP